MKIVKINSTEDTPEVTLDHVNRIFEISGRSLPEDVVVFYQPVINWLEEMDKDPIDNIEFSIKLEYFNTASSKLILDILLKLEDISMKGTSLKVKWHYISTDSDMREAGEEYSEIVSVPFELVEY